MGEHTHTELYKKLNEKVLESLKAPDSDAILAKLEAVKKQVEAKKPKS